MSEVSAPWLHATLADAAESLAAALEKLDIVANDSGKHSGESRISYRGRKRLRYVLYEAAISLVGKNAEFRAIHEYYRTRRENPLKKMQSVVAVACKILRVFYTILTKGVDYDPLKLMGDIRRPQIQAA